MLRICLIIVITLTTSSNGETKYGADCMTPKNEPGLCMPITSCESAHKMFIDLQHKRNKSTSDFLKQSHCGAFENTAYVCCPREQIKLNSEVIEHLKKIDCGSFGKWKISHGEDAGLYDYRWMVLLVHEGENPFNCDGALIDERHVLTAAHCVHIDPIAVRVGEYNIDHEEEDCAIFGGDTKECLDPVKDIPVERVMPHENYVRGQIDHDIALIRLKKPVKCTNSVRPVCLPITVALQTLVPDTYIVAGWGKTEKDIRPSVLQFATIPAQTNEVCNDKLPVKINNGHICAGGKMKQDSCKGDSGGPLFYPTKYISSVRAVQFGIVSAGLRTPKCGEKNLPGIYTNVVDYIQWITDHLVLKTKPSDRSCHTNT